jgi:hypothetical protein
VGKGEYWEENGSVNDKIQKETVEIPLANSGKVLFGVASAELRIYGGQMR